MGAGGQAAGEAGDFEGGIDGEGFLLQVEGGAVAFHGGVGGEDEFADEDPGIQSLGLGGGFGRCWSEAVEELGDGQVGGGDIFEGGDAAEEHVIGAFVDAGGFELEEIFGLFDDADEGMVSGRGRSRCCRDLFSGEVEADRAVFDLVFDVADGVGEGEGVVARGFEEVEGHAFGGAGAHAGEAGEEGHEALEGVGVGGHGVSFEFRVSSFKRNGECGEVIGP